MPVKSECSAKQHLRIKLGLTGSLIRVSGAAGRSGVRKTINGLAVKINQSTRVTIVGAVFVFGVIVVLLVVLRIGSRRTMLTVMPVTTKLVTLYLYATVVTGGFMLSASSQLNSYCDVCSWYGLMAEVKSRKKSGILKRKSEVKAKSNILASRNDYKVIPPRWTIILARGRDTRMGEKIVWTAANTKLQNARIKSQAGNKSIPYQRGAKALARQVNRDTEGKAGMTEDKMRAYVAAWYERYARVLDYVEYCRWCVNSQGFIDSPWGRRRHFYKVDSHTTMASQEREAVNAPIQGTVADCLNVALFNLWMYKQQHPEHAFDIILAIHDAILLEVPITNVEPVVGFVLPLCMVRGVTVPKTDRSSAFQIDIDTDVSMRWGEKPRPGELKALGVPEGYY